MGRKDVEANAKRLILNAPLKGSNDPKVIDTPVHGAGARVKALVPGLKTKGSTSAATAAENLRRTRALAASNKKRREGTRSVADQNASTRANFMREAGLAFPGKSAKEGQRLHAQAMQDKFIADSKTKLAAKLSAKTKVKKVRKGKNQKKTRRAKRRVKRRS